VGHKTGTLIAIMIMKITKLKEKNLKKILKKASGEENISSKPYKYTNVQQKKLKQDYSYFKMKFMYLGHH
jgi:hypothetical protein